MNWKFLESFSVYLSKKAIVHGYNRFVYKIETQLIQLITMGDPLVLGDIQNRGYTVLCYTVFRGTGTVEHPHRKHHSNVMLQGNHYRNRVNHKKNKTSNNYVK